MSNQKKNQYTIGLVFGVAFGLRNWSLKNNHFFYNHLSDMFVYAADDLSFHDG